MVYEICDGFNYVSEYRLSLTQNQKIQPLWQIGEDDGKTKRIQTLYPR